MQHHLNLRKGWIKCQEYYISNEDIYTIPKFSSSLTPHALQNWDTPTAFPLCPFMISGQPMIDYYSNLAVGKVFSTNRNLNNIIEVFEISEDQETIWVLGKNDLTDAVNAIFTCQSMF